MQFPWSHAEVVCAVLIAAYCGLPGAVLTLVYIAACRAGTDGLL